MQPTAVFKWSLFCQHLLLESVTLGGTRVFVSLFREFAVVGGWKQSAAQGGPHFLSQQVQTSHGLFRGTKHWPRFGQIF